MKHFVRFKSDFRRDVKGEIPGRDLAEYLAGCLKDKGFDVVSVENGEFSFFIKCRMDKIDREIMVCLSLQDEDYWEVTCPSSCGVFKRVFHRPESEGIKKLVGSLEDTLRTDQIFESVQWYDNYFLMADDYERVVSKGIKGFNRIADRFLKIWPYLFFGGIGLFTFAAVSHKERGPLGILGMVLFWTAVVGWFGLTGLGMLWGMTSGLLRAKQKKVPKKNCIFITVGILVAAVFIAGAIALLAAIIKNILKFSR